MLATALSRLFAPAAAASRLGLALASCGSRRLLGNCSRQRLLGSNSSQLLLGNNSMTRFTVSPLLESPLCIRHFAAAISASPLLLLRTPSSIAMATAQRQPARSIYWPQGRLDITNRRRRMKRHQLKKFRKRCAAMLRDRRHLRDKKKEAEFRDQLHDLKMRSYGWDPLRKIQERLNLARRTGYSADLLAKIDLPSPPPPTPVKP